MTFQHFKSVSFSPANCSGTLVKGDLDGDGAITVLDIDFVIG